VKILLVEDDRDLLDLLSYSLGRSGLNTITASDPPTALDAFRQQEPDLVLLDVNLGGWSGLDVLRVIREASTVPIILLTALDSEEDKVHGLELGADDYLTKPFSHAELLARIKARLRDDARGWAPTRDQARELVVGPLSLDAAAYTATLAGTPLHLTASEFRLLSYLMQRPGVYIPTTTLAVHLWGPLDAGRRATVRVLLHRLRQKLHAASARQVLLESRPRAGVRLVAQPSVNTEEAVERNTA
jgi:DNA-binding response OmpR family regulator